MLKKFRKMITLALTLALILAVSASVFAVNTWSDIWTASDGTIVEYYATINTERTYGYILSDSNQGEVNTELTFIHNLSGNPETGYLGWNDIDYAYVTTVGLTNIGSLEAAYYSFSAYVPTENGDEYFESGSVELYP